MRYSVLSRRMFLQGAAGAALAIPFLPSLVGTEAKAATPETLKYLQVIENVGALRQHVRPPAQFVPTTNIGANAKSMPLSSIISSNGAISDIYGNWWNAVADKINVISNFNGYVANPNHNTCAATTGSGILPGLDENQQAQFPYSVDWVIAKHFNPTGLDGVLRVNLAKGGSYAKSHCFAGERKNLPLTCSTYEQLVGKIAVTADSAKADDPNRTAFLNHVIEDYRRVANNTRLSQLDRERFEAYTDQVADLQRKEQADQTCHVTKLDDSASYRIRHENALTMMAQAFACGVSRFASYVLIDYADDEYNAETIHTHHHDHGAEIKAVIQWRSQIIAKLVDRLAKTKDETGAPVLDSMVFYHGREYAHALNSTGDAHSNKGYTAVIGGGAGGRLQTGNFIDAGGAPTGRILMTVMKAMGLPINAIEQAGTVGFGEYTTALVPLTVDETAPFLTNTGKRLALPIVQGWDSNGA